MFSYTAVFWKATFQGFPQRELSMLQFIPHFIYPHWLGKEIKVVFHVPVSLFCLEMFVFKQDK